MTSEDKDMAGFVIEAQIRREIEQAGLNLHIEIEYEISRTLPPCINMEELREQALRFWALSKLSMNARLN